MKALLGALAVIFLGFICLVFRNHIKEWLISYHNLKLYGWAWVLILLFFSLTPILIYLLLTRHRILYKDEEDVKNILKSWFYTFSITSSGRQKRRLTINFALCDKHNRLKKGSSEKYLELIANSFGYSTVGRGETTIRLEHPTEPKRSSFLDDLPEL